MEFIVIQADIGLASEFACRWRSQSKEGRAHLGNMMPVGAMQVAALNHPDALMRRLFMFLLDHYASDESSETFRLALRDPVAFVREAALHGLTCERCRYGKICISDTVTELLQVLSSDPSAEVRHKTVVALTRFLGSDNRAGEAIARAAGSDPDPAVRYVARTVADSRQPHHSGRKKALRDEQRARRTG